AQLWMPRWMNFTGRGAPPGLYGIHELPEWRSGKKEGENHLGVPVSGGCIRLGVGPAQSIYAWADVGTTVVVR
ncbi:MAG: L,D-transpeptidase, partial [bacterium]|nr:L,D-transpeptidase [bacterium]